MKLHQYYEKHFKEYGDIKAVKHPYHDTTITKPNNCMFNKVCHNPTSLLCMSSRKDNEFLYVCKSCLQPYFTSWAQPFQDAFEYLKFSHNIDLNKEVNYETTD